LSGTKIIRIAAALKMELEGAFENQGFEVNYLGLGKINAASSITTLIHQCSPTHIINVGTAGSSKFPAGTIVECSGTVQRDMDVSPLGFAVGQTPFDEIDGLIDLETFITDAQHGICGTGDSFETSEGKVAYDLVDMEGYAIAKVCKKFGVGCTLLKFISDGSDHTAHADWSENLKHAGPALLIACQKLFYHLT